MRSGRTPHDAQGPGTTREQVNSSIVELPVTVHSGVNLREAECMTLRAYALVGLGPCCDENVRDSVGRESSPSCENGGERVDKGCRVDGCAMRVT